MKRLATVFAVALLAVPASADAAYYIGKPVAEHYARIQLHNYGYTNVGVYCQPKKGKNENYNNHGHVLWHKWYCGFVEAEPGDSCKGTISIYGSDAGAGFYYYRHGSVGEDC